MTELLNEALMAVKEARRLNDRACAIIKQLHREALGLPDHGKFDRTAYQRELMRKRRQKNKGPA